MLALALAALAAAALLVAVTRMVGYGPGRAPKKLLAARPADPAVGRLEAGRGGVGGEPEAAVASAAEVGILWGPPSRAPTALPAVTATPYEGADVPGPVRRRLAADSEVEV